MLLILSHIWLSSTNRFKHVGSDCNLFTTLVSSGREDTAQGSPFCSFLYLISVSSVFVRPPLRPTEEPTHTRRVGAAGGERPEEARDERARSSVASSHRPSKLRAPATSIFCSLPGWASWGSCELRLTRPTSRSVGLDALQGLMECVRSIWLPSNRLLLAANVFGMAAALLLASRSAMAIDFIPVAAASGWFCSWAALCIVRLAEEWLCHMDAEICQDRRALSLALFGLPAGASSLCALSLARIVLWSLHESPFAQVAECKQKQR